MNAPDVLDLARENFREQSWKAALDGFRLADAQRALGAADLDRAARCAYLTGNDDECIRLLERAFAAHAAEDRAESACESAFWLGFTLTMNRGEAALAAGWLARAERLLTPAHRAEHDPVCAAHGLLILAPAIGTLLQGDAARALPALTEAHGIGLASGHRDLTALSGLGVGQARILLGDPEAGLTILDEVMVSVTTGEVSPVAAGIVYCAVIITCHETYQLRRAAEWTRALGNWCDAQVDLVPFRGQCLVHRAEMLQLRGSWKDAMEQARFACRMLTEPPGGPAVGMALYELAELHRLRGEFAAAETAYRRAGGYGHEIQPGLARLRLAQGDLGAARAGIERALAETVPLLRPRMLEALVDIALAAGDVASARCRADELEVLAQKFEATALTAMAAQARGAVDLADGDPCSALHSLRTAWRLWRDLDAPYQCAQVRVLQGHCCAALDDHEAARMEFDSATATFRELGAEPDLHRLRQLTPSPGTSAPAGLTGREIEVLREVAGGGTNREVAAALFLSEKTVARHLSNIFTKLGVSSRAGATAYAYEHHLV
ncbi:LuxR C-terminal-related transcriptional regulator [Rhodococcus chondri]|uniref:LuxR C-terminal-related transcriptional regulator n=1 Tax=Rhodococcus chondri TaxID=3065941 RepID=A0ABU7JWZ8_9NOCA|nr:LuxR C-terminal-related transcriptional regulator [Rhodococcus sp. CC-R104]MEE2034545.1 LuxR C-terminal-related transcriptional regulator [Rhodococcus sp. CC-R104]